MKLLWLILFFNTLLCFSQSDADYLSHGTKSGDFGTFYKYRTIKDFTYESFAKGVKQKLISDKKFNPKQLETPNSVANAMFTATSVDWYKQLLDDTNNIELSVKDIEYRKSKQFKKDFEFSTYVEFYFSLDSVRYCCLLAYHNVRGGIKVCIPVATVKTDKGWKVCTEKTLVEFSGYLYLKPKVFYDLFSDRVDALLKEYISYMSDFTVDRGFYLAAFLKNDTNGLGELLIPKFIPNSNILTIKFKANKYYRYGKHIIEPIGHGLSTYTYDKDEFSFSDFTYAGEVYSKTPEDALVSWTFAKSEAEHDKHTLKGKNHNWNTEARRIKLLEKIVFEYKDTTYATMYYEYFESYIDSKGFQRERFKGFKRALLKYVSDEWVLDFKGDAYLNDMILCMDKFSLYGLEKAFELKNGNDIAYISDEGLRHFVTIFMYPNYTYVNFEFVALYYQLAIKNGPSGEFEKKYFRQYRLLD